MAQESHTTVKDSPARRVQRQDRELSYPLAVRNVDETTFSFREISVDIEVPDFSNVTVRSKKNKRVRIASDVETTMFNNGTPTNPNTVLQTGEPHDPQGIHDIFDDDHQYSFSSDGLSEEFDGPSIQMAPVDVNNRQEVYNYLLQKGLESSDVMRFFEALSWTGSMESFHDKNDTYLGNIPNLPLPTNSFLGDHEETSDGQLATLVTDVEDEQMIPQKADVQSLETGDGRHQHKEDTDETDETLHPNVNMSTIMYTKQSTPNTDHRRSEEVSRLHTSITQGHGFLLQDQDRPVDVEQLVGIINEAELPTDVPRMYPSMMNREGHLNKIQQQHLDLERQSRRSELPGLPLHLGLEDLVIREDD